MWYRSALALTLLTGAVLAQQADPFPIPHEPEFKRHAARWLPHYDYRWLAAQCFQESRYSATARSPAGAMGYCQFMPKTWAEARIALRVTDPNHAPSSIRAAAWYMQRMERIWRAPRPEWSRRQLAQASYNAGAGNIIAAQRKCGEARDWPRISPCLRDVTGRHSAETIDYVDKIREWYCRICQQQ